MPAEIVAALIGGGAGLATGIVGTIFAPWVNWGIEKRRLRRQRRTEQVKEWRDRIQQVRWIEKDLLKPDTGVLSVAGIYSPDDADVRQQTWFATFKTHLTRDQLQELDRMYENPLESRRGDVARFIEDRIGHVERDVWGLD
ncbi:hypothetical protein [Mycobacterium sp. 236(2023)]|uniref:hypothetical protein n=1 Tax=Mycobacterium sp. 236(2023) TaxID=3038163 RepID=UPI0024150753|nr:hypothetical protein [Mycobacterium sp. 236(2023)]MDG4667003.1 hypothetical protein [Mycobacterium sp. 236(2023)]